MGELEAWDGSGRERNEANAAEEVWRRFGGAKGSRCVADTAVGYKFFFRKKMITFGY